MIWSKRKSTAPTAGFRIVAEAALSTRLLLSLRATPRIVASHGLTLS